MIFFSSWDSIGRIFVIGILAYVGLICMLRISGKRTLSQMNSFDFIITIAMGSTFSSGLLDKQIALLDTLVALGLLIGIQFLITKLSVRSSTVNSLVKGTPSLLFQKGEFYEPEMRKVRVGKDEMLASMREQGISTFSQVEVIVLETNGKLSAIPKQLSEESLLPGTVKSYKDARNQHENSNTLSNGHA